MDNVAFCILTRARSDKQTTLKNLHPKIRNMIYLVVDKSEYKSHNKYQSKVKKILKFPDGWGKWNGNFSDKKEWTSNNIKERYYFILDDDLSFFARKDGRLVKARKFDVLSMFKLLYKYMKDENYAHVALSLRGGNNHVSEDIAKNTRATAVCGFDLKIVKKEKVVFNSTPLMADFDITLSLLEKGYPNIVIYKYANSHRISNDQGGCSLYRTPELMEKAAEMIKSRHNQFVKIQQKITSKPWANFDTKVRTDVKISWKKAYKYGKMRKKGGMSKFLKRGR